MTAPAATGPQPTAPTEPAAPHDRLPRPLLLTLALLAAIAPFATDLYLPSLPDLATDLDTSATGAQLSLTAFLIGMAVGQAVLGPLSDRVGRFPPLLIGAIVCVAVSIVAALAPTVTVLVIARVIQGLTGSAGMVIGRAIIADLVTGAAAGRAFSLVMIVGGIAPVLAPLIGGLLAEPLGWRGLLFVVAALATLMLIAVIAVVRESHPPARRAELRAARGQVGLRSLGARGYLGPAMTFVFGFTAMMAYISASPFVYQTMLGLDELQYGLAFGVNALGLVVTSAVAARLAGRVPAARQIRIGAGVQAAGALSVLVVALSGAPVWLLMPALFFSVAPLGFILGNTTALALGAVRAAGLGSAAIGAGQFGVAALASPLVSVWGESDARPLGMVMVASVAIAWIGILVTPRARA